MMSCLITIEIYGTVISWYCIRCLWNKAKLPCTMDNLRGRDTNIILIIIFTVVTIRLTEFAMQC